MTEKKVFEKVTGHCSICKTERPMYKSSYGLLCTVCKKVTAVKHGSEHMDKMIRGALAVK